MAHPASLASVASFSHVRKLASTSSVAHICPTATLGRVSAPVSAPVAAREEDMTTTRFDRLGDGVPTNSPRRSDRRRRRALAASAATTALGLRALRGTSARVRETHDAPAGINDAPAPRRFER
eukprot:29979-Pelagococcus_subviridis.AAC.5